MTNYTSHNTIRKIGKSHYQHDSGFQIYKSTGFWNELKWAIVHENYEKLQNWLNEGNDQCHATLQDAVNYLNN